VCAPFVAPPTFVFCFLRKVCMFIIAHLITYVPVEARYEAVYQVCT
jgi:hypothetical protein